MAQHGVDQLLPTYCILSESNRNGNFLPKDRKGKSTIWFPPIAHLNDGEKANVRRERKKGGNERKGKLTWAAIRSALPRDCVRLLLRLGLGLGLAPRLAALVGRSLLPLVSLWVGSFWGSSGVAVGLASSLRHFGWSVLLFERLKVF